jgi:pimeloyl-ACP methyl ester carboxylesterase
MLPLHKQLVTRKRALRRMPINERRDACNGGFVELSEGVAHYLIEGTEDGVPLVAIHGATVPSWQFDLLFPLLHGRGFRTLRFDLYGHGLSDRPRLAYKLDLFVGQTLELLAATSFPPPTVVLGHSLGAAITAAVAPALPVTRKLVLSAPLLDFSTGNLFASLLRLPMIGEMLMRGFGSPALARRRRRRYQAIGRPEFARRFDEQAAREGFRQALLSMVRCNTLADHGDRYQTLGRCGRDVLIVWSNRDRVVSPEHIDRIRRLVIGHEYAELDGTEHNHLFTAPEQVAAAIANFALPVVDSKLEPKDNQ